MTACHWLLFILSAILYAAPSLLSSYLWPLIFVFPLPLLYIALYNTFYARHGFLWGVIAYGLYLCGVFWGMDNFAQGSIVARFAPAIILISYAALYSTAWFALNKKIITYFSLQTTLQKLSLWVISYWLFIMTMELVSFWNLGRIEGYFAFNPIFVLAEKPQLLRLLPYIGKPILTVLLISFSGSIVYWYLQRTFRSFLWILIFSLPWIISLLLPLPKMEKPEWLSKIAYLPVNIYSRINLTEQASIAQELFKKMINGHPKAELIIMPESSITCDHLSTAPELCAMWSEKELGRPLHIIAGSFRWDGPAYRNTLHWFFNGKLIKMFDKRHAMLLTEMIPQFYKIKLFEDLFFSKFPGITPSTLERPLFDVLKGISFIPYICSELFFNDKPDDNYPPGSTILATTNDLWCQTTNVPQLMCLDARFRAIQWQRNILYVSYLYTKYFDMYGNQINLRLRH